jgi:hypothetical protein
MLNQDRFNKYFWDHTQDASDVFKLRRLFEYASFPDLIKIPFVFLKNNSHSIDIDKLRTSKDRIHFLKRIKSSLKDSQNWDEVIKKSFT